MIYIGIDDTDIVGSPGTNQLARAIVRSLGDDAAGSVICRHQLFFDRRVPYTSKNGSASIALPAIESAHDVAALIDEVRDVMRVWFIDGSDPGLCVSDVVAPTLHDFGLRCQREVVRQDDARAIAARLGMYLEGLGGTEQGVIGALAAIGLAASGEDGRIVQLHAWPYPDDFSGKYPVAAVHARGVDEIRDLASGALVTDGIVDVGKHLRPNKREGRIVLFVVPTDDTGGARAGGSAWRAMKLT